MVAVRNEAVHSLATDAQEAIRVVAALEPYKGEVAWVAVGNEPLSDWQDPTLAQ
jgi:hypothetical protein